MIWADLRTLKARIVELEAELVQARSAVGEPVPPGPLGWVYYSACSKCGKERAIDISPLRVVENHTMQLAEDDHRAWLVHLQSPEAVMAAQQQLAEAREEAEGRQRARERQARGDDARDRVQMLQTLHDGPWGGQGEGS